MNVALPLILAVASSLSFAVPTGVPTDAASEAVLAAPQEPQGQDGKKGKKDAEKDQKEHPAEHGAWGTDHAAAMAAAKKEKKPVLLLFTGSDWCPPCKKLHAEVFASDEFKAWAKDKVVLLELDFPRNKEQPAELAKQNKELQKEFKVSGYPTVIFVDAKGKKLHSSSGYGGEGVAAWIKKVEKDLKKK